jgi:hypothetical protein
MMNITAKTKGVITLRKAGDQDYDVYLNGERVGGIVKTGVSGRDDYPWDWSITLPDGSVELGHSDIRRAGVDVISSLLGALAPDDVSSLNKYPTIRRLPRYVEWAERWGHDSFLDGVAS